MAALSRHTHVSSVQEPTSDRLAYFAPFDIQHRFIASAFPSIAATPTLALHIPFSYSINAFSNATLFISAQRSIATPPIIMASNRHCRSFNL
jgi:hypothetical protein